MGAFNSTMSLAKAGQHGIKDKGSNIQLCWICLPSPGLESEAGCWVRVRGRSLGYLVVDGEQLIWNNWLTV